MPITLPPISRRRFLAGSLAAGAGLLLERPGFATQVKSDPHRFALLADTHIAEDRTFVARGTHLTKNLTQVSGEVIGLDRAPSAVFIDGDCAYSVGTRGDYATLIDLLKPMREAGLPIHLGLGNHDHRVNFWEAIPRDQGQTPAVANRHLTVLPSERANWFVLDSLDETNKTPGVMGPAQLAWLAKCLDAQANKPALVLVHHNPDERPKPGGLVETKELFDILLPRKHVKALIFGHSHNWLISEREGLHLINLPPVAYPFSKEKPSGWVDAQLLEASMTLELRSVDPQHPQHGQKVELAWRV